MSADSRIVTGVILAGGAARRFGGAPKGLARIGDRRSIDRVADALASATDRMLLLTNDPHAAAWLPNVPVFGDIEPGAGSLEGIRSALARAGTAVVVVAWDMPFVSAALVSALRDAAADGATAVVPDGPHGVEPLCAFYAARCLPTATALLAAGERRARALAEHVDAVHLPAHLVARCGDPHMLFRNVNSRGDLAAARAAWQDRRTAPVVASPVGDPVP